MRLKFILLAGLMAMSANAAADTIYAGRQACLEVLKVHPMRLQLTAKGEASTSGWSAPDLIARTYEVSPEDGILDLDFTATRPTGIALTVISPISVKVQITAPEWLKGVRIHSNTTALELPLNNGVCTSDGLST